MTNMWTTTGIKQYFATFHQGEATPSYRFWEEQLGDIRDQAAEQRNTAKIFQHRLVMSSARYLMFRTDYRNTKQEREDRLRIYKKAQANDVVDQHLKCLQLVALQELKTTSIDMRATRDVLHNVRADNTKVTRLIREIKAEMRSMHPERVVLDDAADEPLEVHASVEDVD